MTPDKIKALRESRGSVYGDPRENHRGIAQAWAGMLEPHWRSIQAGNPIPEHTVAHMMAALKMNRMRRVFHQDNYDDIAVYLKFAHEWQKDYKAPEHIGPHHIYVAGAYSNPDPEIVRQNVKAAVNIATLLMQKGHLAHCPHAATDPIEKADVGRKIGYEDYMTLDFSIIRLWATAMYRCPGESNGADREVELARDLGLPVWTSLDEVPALRPGTTGDWSAQDNAVAHA